MLSGVEMNEKIYTITTGTIPEFEADNGEIIPEYNGLLAYSDSLEHGVLQIDDITAGIH